MEFHSRSCVNINHATKIQLQRLSIPTRLPRDNDLGLEFILFNFFQWTEASLPIKLELEEPDDGAPRPMQKVPSLSDLSDPEASIGEFLNMLCL